MKVSVIMLTYGHEKYIEEAINGVLMQQYEGEIELIIANDKSPDNSAAIISKIIHEHPKGYWIKYTCHEVNLGMMHNFRWALQKCKGKYIAVCEGDDYWTDPLKLQNQVDFMEAHTNVFACGTNYNKHFSDRIQISNAQKSLKFFDHYDIIVESRLGTLTTMYRAPIQFPEYLLKCNFGDMSVLLCNTTKSEKVAVLPFNSANYRVHDKGVYSGLSTMRRIQQEFSDKLLFVENNKKDIKFLKVSLNLYLRLAIINLLRVIALRPDARLIFSITYFKMVFIISSRYIKAN